MYAQRLIPPVFLLFILAPTTYAQMSVARIAEENTRSVVTIVALDSNDQPLALGSGFFIDAHGNIATNHHVLQGSAKAIVKTTKGAKGEILEILQDDPDLDLVIAKTSLKNTMPIPLGDSDAITIGEDIVAIGNPAGLEGTISKGIISGIRNLEGMKFIQITAPISPGSSGGPVFNMAGKVIGVATAYLEGAQNLNFAMPVNYLKDLKPSHAKLFALPKAVPKGSGKGKEEGLVQLFDITISDSVRIDFAIKNVSDYPIKNIKLFFIYKNGSGEVISYSTETIGTVILPRLGLQFWHFHDVRYPHNGTFEIRILDYEIDRSGRSSPIDLLFKM